MNLGGFRFADIEVIRRLKSMDVLFCELCQQETRLLIPVVNLNPFSPSRYDLVCPDCAEVVASEHDDGLLGHAIDFQDVVNGRVLVFELVA